MFVWLYFIAFLPLQISEESIVPPFKLEKISVEDYFW